MSAALRLAAFETKSSFISYLPSRITKSSTSVPGCALRRSYTKKTFVPGLCHRISVLPPPSHGGNLESLVSLRSCVGRMGGALPGTRRKLHVTIPLHAAPKSKDRGPKSEEDTQTDFGTMDILSNTPVPTTAVDACMDDGFALDSGLKVSGSGVLLLGGEAFKWRPWIREGRKEGTIGAGAVGDDDKGLRSVGGKLLNRKGQWDVNPDVWGVLDLVWPKPDLLILGTGPRMVPISPETRRQINDLGIRVEVQDTRNAAAQFNLLATERGVQQVAAALVPIGWREGK